MINAVSLSLWDFCSALHRRRLKGIGGLLFLCVGLCLSPGTWADDDPQVTVNDAFINVHNGPGRGYPVFHVVERGETITLLKSRTDWIKIKTYLGNTGWVRRSD